MACANPGTGSGSGQGSSQGSGRIVPAGDSQEGTTTVVYRPPPLGVAAPPSYNEATGDDYTPPLVHLPKYNDMSYGPPRYSQAEGGETIEMTQLGPSPRRDSTSSDSSTATVIFHEPGQPSRTRRGVRPQTVTTEDNDCCQRCIIM